ncbi:MAG TPA: SGNH/GDSL hydrolase family protein [Acidobacteriaceae bacterium]|nr:SGNH/GDSL hydrolase family protein [Acidobacteriaceae bacterium]
MKNLAVFLCFAAILTLCAPAQSAPDNGSPQANAQQGIHAVENLDRWRETLIPMFMNDYGDLNRYRAADLALGSPAPNQQRVLFFGDSITDIWNLDQSFPGRQYINRGISGQTTPQMLVRFRQDVIDLHPAVVLILAGTNDIAGNTGPESVAEIEGNYASMAELARAAGIRVVFSSVTPINGSRPEWTNYALLRSPRKILELNDWLQHYCAEHGLVYLDYYSAMVDSDGRMKPDLTGDGLHPNLAGFAVMAPLAQAAIEKALSQPVTLNQ